MVFLLSFLLGFNNEFQNFINSPRSESIFVALMQDKTKIIDYKDDPVILWFWRSRTNDTKVDSFLKKISIPRNFYLSGVLRWEAKESKDLKEQYNKLKLAIHFDSLSIENFLSLISLGISNRKMDFVKHAFSLPVFSDFRNQIILLGNFFILFILTLFFTTILFILTKLIYYLPVLSHRFDPMKHNIFKGIIGFALLLIPVLILRNFYLSLIVYSVILTFIFNSREKNWLRINLILIIISSIAISMFNFVPFLKGNDKVYHMYQMVALDSDIRINPETRIEKEVLAYALKKQGAYDEAMALYEDLYYNQNIRSVDIMNNLANLYTIYDEDERAEELYRKATYSERGEPYFNLALLKLKKIEYLAAGEIMEEARKRGFVSVSKEPVDIAPNLKNFYNLLITKNLNNGGFVKVKYLIIILAVFFITFIPFKLPPPYYCSICGRAVCKVCTEETGDEFYCRACLNKLNATKNEEIEGELKYALGRTKRLSKNIFTIVLNIILPGAGLIYKNKNFWGLLISFFAIMVYTPILLKSYFIKPSGWVSFPLSPIFLVIALIVLILCYLISFLILIGGSDAD
ncbi:MAG: hypothetical protein ABIL69_07155 [candidate division WOR-3 bacterium]